MMAENSVYATIERIHELDIDASIVTKDQRVALKEIAELEKKSKVCETLLVKSRNDMSFNETELLRLYKKIDDLEEKKTEKSARLSQTKSDDDHRSYKREVDSLDREIRDLTRRTDEAEARIEHSKKVFFESEKDLSTTVNASRAEFEKAQSAKDKTSGRLDEISKVRENYLRELDDRVASHYSRVAKVTRNPNGPICRVFGSACGNCRIGLSPQILNHIVRGKIVEFCPNCSHVLLPQNSL